MHQDAHQSTDEPGAQARFIDWDAFCRTCGYSLRGLASGGACPECGASIEFSLRGDRLLNASPVYVRALARGATLIVISLIVNIIATALGIIFPIALALTSGGSWQHLSIIQSMLETLVTLVSLVGWWILSARDPGFEGRGDGSTARTVVRIAVIVGAVSSFLSLGAAVLVSTAGASSAPQVPGALPATPSLGLIAMAIIPGVIAAIAWGVKFFASMLYLRWLTPRIPSPGLYRQAGLYMWLLPVVFVVFFLCLALGPLAAWIMYLIMMIQLRAALRRVSEMQRRDPRLTSAIS